MCVLLPWNLKTSLRYSATNLDSMATIGLAGFGYGLDHDGFHRNLPDVGFVPKGTPITCTMCHGNEL